MGQLFLVTWLDYCVSPKNKTSCFQFVMTSIAYLSLDACTCRTNLQCKGVASLEIQMYASCSYTAVHDTLSKYK